MTWSDRLLDACAALVAAGALLLVVGYLLVLCGGPLATADLWWHLAMGEAYATQGPWPDGDPLLHTAHEDAPVQHEWAFDVALHGVERAFGLPGVRGLHVVAVLAILALLLSVFRRASATRAEAWLATSVFVLMAWWRLFQIRPDLVSIPATFVLYRLLLESGAPPSRARVIASAGLIWIWANAHSLFLVGPLLLLAGLAGIGARALLARWAGLASRAGDGAHAKRIAAAVGLGLALALLNPRGIAQHLTFLISSRETAVWAISDEWMHFDPFDWRGYGDAVALPAWIAADAVMAAFALVVVWGFVRFVRRPSAERLRTSDPLPVALGVAGVVAALVSVRFLWMLGFPLLHLLRTRPALAPARAGALGALGALAVVAASVAIAWAFPRVEGFRVRLDRAPSDVRTYLTTHYDEEKFYEEAVRFLEETGLEGKLYNTYAMGGFLAYRLAPRLRTFVDGRTEHYGPDVLEDYLAIVGMQGVRPGETFLDVLDRRQVDVFVGTGAPPMALGRRYTSAHLEGAPGWILVSRSLRHGIYLRRNVRNRENLERVAAYYEREGVPFDPARGLEVEQVIRARPGWAERHQLVPTGYGGMLARSSGDNVRRRGRALNALATAAGLIGAYESQIDWERRAIALAPKSKPPRRRLVFALLRLDRPDDALAEAEALLALDPDDPLSSRYLETVHAYIGARRALESPDPDAPRTAPQALVNGLALR